jgi:hypothetical protein
VVRDTISISGKQKHLRFVNFVSVPARPSGKGRCKSLGDEEGKVMGVDCFEGA